jgi:large subunit ribosomal protein L35
MPKLKTHKGMKKRFKVSATGKVSHKRCGSSHLNSHKSGKQIRRLRKKAILKNAAEALRVRRAVKQRQSTNPDAVEAAQLAVAGEVAEAAGNEAAADRAAARAENVAESAG